MEDFWNIAKDLLLGIGGISGIIMIITKIIINILSKRLEENYKMHLQNELENERTILSNKTHVTKMKFDTEFSIYKDLSKSFFNMIKDIQTLIPCGINTQISNNADTQRSAHLNNYYIAQKSTYKAQNKLIRNEAFIQKDIFDKYSELITLCREQLIAFDIAYQEFYIEELTKILKLSPDDYRRTNIILHKYSEINQHIRRYLSNIDII